MGHRFELALVLIGGLRRYASISSREIDKGRESDANRRKKDEKPRGAQQRQLDPFRSTSAPFWYRIKYSIVRSLLV